MYKKRKFLFSDYFFPFFLNPKCHLWPSLRSSEHYFKLLRLFIIHTLHKKLYLLKPKLLESPTYMYIYFGYIYIYLRYYILFSMKHLHIFVNVQINKCNYLQLVFTLVSVTTGWGVVKYLILIVGDRKHEREPSGTFYSGNLTFGSVCVLDTIRENTNMPADFITA